MKTKTLLFLIFAFLGISLVKQVNAQTSWDRSMLPIIGEGYRNIFYMGGETGRKVYYVEFDLVKKESVREIRKTLNAGQKYEVVVWGDFRIKDIGISTYKKNSSGEWTLVVKDNETDYLSKLSFSSVNSEEFKFEIACEPQKGFDGGHYGFCIVQLESGSSYAEVSTLPVFSLYDVNRKTIGGFEKSENKFEVVHLEFGIIKKGVPTETIRMLVTDWGVYGLLADATDKIVPEVDLCFYKKNYNDGRWELVFKSNETKQYESYAQKIYATDEYKISVVPTEFESGYSEGYYSLIIYHR